MGKDKPLLYDQYIVHRIKSYLEENLDKTYIDVSEMTRALQAKYPEYGRRKFAPFRALVQQAYVCVSENYGLSVVSSGDDSNISDNIDVTVPSGTSSAVNNMMNNLYNKNKQTLPAMPRVMTPITDPVRIDTDVAINISSDEDEQSDFIRNKNKDEELIVLERNVQRVVAMKAKARAQAAAVVQPPILLPKKFVENDVEVNPARKRSENDVQQLSNNIPPVKKQKTDRNSVVAPQLRNPVSQQRHQQQINSASFDQTESDSSNGGSNFSLGRNKPASSPNQLRPRKYKHPINISKSRYTFQDIGGMEKPLKELCELLLTIKSPDIYYALGLAPPRGILLHGPAGCGKTLLAHAIAGQLNLPLVETQSTELISGVSGESEERIRELFEQVYVLGPCVLFLDEIDAISSNRAFAQKDMERRVVSQLIASFDCLRSFSSGQSVIIVGATTRPDLLDPGLRRSGRFDHEIAIGIPSRKDRREILSIICESLNIDTQCEFDRIAELTPGYVGADLVALVSRAATVAIKRKCQEQIQIAKKKAQENMTIVELDDGDDIVIPIVSNDKNNLPNDENTNKQIEKEQNKDKINVDNENGDKQDIAKILVDEVNVNENEVKKTNDEPMVVDDDIEADKSKDDTSNDANNQVIANKKVDANKDTDTNTTTTTASSLQEINNEISKNRKEELKSVIRRMRKEVMSRTEPTLFELLNWLDNPPDTFSIVQDFNLTFSDFTAAIKVLQPSAKREGFVTVPDVTWGDIGSLKDIREELRLAVLAPVKYPIKMARLGLTAPSGVLLCGPPGCGKTLIAKAIANEAGVNFISVKGPELMNMFVGESERAVRACFQRARNSAPCVIFFDEFDSICPIRNNVTDSGSGVRIVNQLLTEMDGIEERKGVYILAATNRPDIIDPAILRPGRLDTILYVGLPNVKDREEIFIAVTKNRMEPVLHDDVSLEELSVKTDGYTGADIAGLIRQASIMALKESLEVQSTSDDNDLCVRMKHFQAAFEKLRPSVSEKDRQMYDKLRLRYATMKRTTDTKADPSV